MEGIQWHPSQEMLVTMEQDWFIAPVSRNKNHHEASWYMDTLHGYLRGAWCSERSNISKQQNVVLRQSRCHTIGPVMVIRVISWTWHALAWWKYDNMIIWLYDKMVGGSRIQIGPDLTRWFVNHGRRDFRIRKMWLPVTVFTCSSANAMKCGKLEMNEMWSTHVTHVIQQSMLPLAVAYYNTLHNNHKSR